MPKYLKKLIKHIVKEAYLIEMPQITDFDEWLSKEGGVGEAFKQYNINYKERFRYLADQYENEEEAEEAMLDAAKEELRNRFYDIMYHYESLEFPLTLYRAIQMKSLRNLRRKNLGEYWTDDISAAEPHWGNYSEGTGTFILQAEVDEKDLDWEWTLAHNMSLDLGEEEKEINVKKGAIIKLLRIQKPDGTWYKINKMLRV